MNEWMFKSLNHQSRSCLTEPNYKLSAIDMKSSHCLLIFYWSSTSGILRLLFLLTTCTLHLSPKADVPEWDRLSLILSHPPRSSYCCGILDSRLFVWPPRASNYELLEANIIDNSAAVHLKRGHCYRRLGNISAAGLTPHAFSNRRADFQLTWRCLFIKARCSAPRFYKPL